MPVPVSVTNPKGVGLTGHYAAPLETSGPFARIAAQKSDDVEPTSKPEETPSEQAERTTTEATDAAASTMNVDNDHNVVVRGLTFAYPGLDGRPVPGMSPLISNMTFSLKPGSRCLLLGGNGAGKTTLLKILGGKHMVPQDCVSVLGRPPFHDTNLTASGDLSYVGGNWTRDVAFAGCSVPLTGDFPASKMIDSVPGVDPARKARLIKALDVDPDWRMHQVSDGQRRRVQICVGMLKPFKVLLLDEITVDLDVLGRAELMQFLKEECEQRGATILYATHIFDGLEFWPSHIAYMARGVMRVLKDAKDVPELGQGKLLELVYALLSEEADAVEKARGGPRSAAWDPSREGQVDSFSYVFNNGWVPGTMGSSLSTNAVMRM